MYGISKSDAPRDGLPSITQLESVRVHDRVCQLLSHFKHENEIAPNRTTTVLLHAGHRTSGAGAGRVAGLGSGSGIFHSESRRENT
jgi:hypothetical protein